jgi:hypothetical protein
MSVKKLLNQLSNLAAINGWIVDLPILLPKPNHSKVSLFSLGDSEIPPFFIRVGPLIMIILRLISLVRLIRPTNFLNCIDGLCL